MRMMAAIQFDVGLRMIPALVALLVVLVTVGLAQERDRSKISDKYKWNLADFNPTDAAWRDEKDPLLTTLGPAKACMGKHGQSATQQAKALAAQPAQEKTLSRL